MSLATAIRQNATPLGQAQTTYKQDVAMVNTFINAVLTSKLPPLNTKPPDWQEFINAYEQAESDALQWVNTVMARLLQIPEDVAGYNPTISQILGDAKSQAEKLIADPSDPDALAILDNDLQDLTGQLSLVTTFISGAVKAVQDFGDVLPAMSQQLQAIATKSANDAKADQEKINTLNADIESLRSDIKSLTADLIGLGIADGVALTLGVVVTIAAWPVGLVAWLALGPVVVVATTYIAIDSNKIVADKAKIKSDQEEITGLTQDVATLQLLASHYAAMVAETDEIEASLQAILTAWQQLESDVNAAVTDIRTAIADASSAAFQAVLNDVTDAIAEWDAAYAAAGELTLDLQVNNASLALGMSSAEIQSALASGQSMDVIAYFNEVGTQ